MSGRFKYKINEIFYSIQGEGYHTGRPYVFVRLSGCNLSCDFCDTPHDTYKELSSNQILSEIQKYPCSDVLLTGGEPFLQDLTQLLQTLKRAGCFIAVETNGCYKIPPDIDWSCVSPKTDDFIQCGDELKLLYRNQSDHELKKYSKLDFKHFYLQPISGENINQTYNAVLRNPSWRLSVQLHKLISIK
jgi:organic radical activating enzyme